MSVGNAAFGQVVRADFDGHSVSREDTNVVHTHLAGDVGDHFMVVLELHAKHRVGECFEDFAFELEFVFLGQLNLLSGFY